ALNLTGLQFITGINYVFPEGTLLGAGKFYVLVSNAALFAQHYPSVTIGGTYNKRLSNGGDKLTLVDASNAVGLSVTYGDAPPWPVVADGLGFSLVPTDPNAATDQNNALNWRASANPGGSPGADDPIPAASGVIINELLTHTDPPALDTIELYNTSGTAVDI